MLKRICASALLISGCAQSYSPQVDAFATSFAAANKNFSETIERVEQRIAASDRSLWARDRTPLITTSECLRLSTLSDQEFDADLCQLKPTDPNASRLSNLQSDNFTALARQLSNYANALQRLSADTTAERDSFEKAVVDAFGSVGKFDALLTELGGEATGFGPFADQLGQGIAKALSLLAERRRFEALRRTVNDADTVIQSATARLDAAGVILGGIDTDLALELLNRSRQNANARLKDQSASIEAREKAIQALQEEIVVYRAVATLSRKGRFATAAKAHAALRQSIEQRKDINPDTALAFATAISELTQIAESLPDTLPEN